MQGTKQYTALVSLLSINSVNLFFRGYYFTDPQAIPIKQLASMKIIFILANCFCREANESTQRLSCNIYLRRIRRHHSRHHRNHRHHSYIRCRP